MKAEVTKATKLAPECTPHIICIGVKLTAETKEDGEIINMIRQLPEDRNWTSEVSSYSISCKKKELEVEIVF